MVSTRIPSLTVIGIDAATDAKKTGLARGRIDSGRLVAEPVELGSKASPVAKVVASRIRGPTLIAIDAPPDGPNRWGARWRATVRARPSTSRGTTCSPVSRIASSMRRRGRKPLGWTWFKAAASRVTSLEPLDYEHVRPAPHGLPARR